MTEVDFPAPKAPDPVYWVTSTKSPEAGSEVLNEIVFPYFSLLHNEYDAYQSHRNYHKKRMEAYLERKSWADYGGFVACRDFMDELIYFADWEMLKYCDRDLSPSLCRDEADRKRVDAQRAAIRDGKRDEFLMMLEKRKKQFVTKLECKVGIKVELK